MHKDMTYRKPAPIYIPSPPSSPVAQPLPPPPEDALQLPPLPGDWREVIEQALHTSKSVNAFIVPEVIRVPSIAEEESPNENQPSSPINVSPDERPISPPNSPPFISGRRSKRRLHQHYRPPTPPLRLHHQQSRLQSNGFTSLTSIELYRQDSDGSRKVYHYTSRPSMRGNSFATLRSPSFGTEKTQTSFANSEPQTTWSGGLSTLVGHSEHTLPVLPMHVVRLPKSRSRNLRRNKEKFSESTVSWWDRIGTRLRSFRRVVVGVLSCR